VLIRIQGSAFRPQWSSSQCGLSRLYRNCLVDNHLTNVPTPWAKLAEMKSRATVSVPTLRQIAEEMDRLFQRQTELMKSETFVGLTPAQREEYDKIGEKIRELFAELAKHK
jgi:hypothetical protein